MKSFWTDETLADLHKLAAEGISLARASVRMRRSSDAVRKKAKELGISFKDHAVVRTSSGLTTRWAQNRNI